MLNFKGVSGGPDGTRTRPLGASPRAEAREGIETGRKRRPTDGPRQTRVHFTSHPLKRVRAARKQYTEVKPRGLWYSVQRDQDQWMGWLEWCRSEEFRYPEEFAHAFAIEVDPSDLLILDSDAAIEAFSREFSVPSCGRFREIEWKRVASEFKGVEIAPYSWRHRHDPETFWYYGWDCASGCVWDPTAVVGIKEVALGEVPTSGPGRSA